MMFLKSAFKSACFDSTDRLKWLKANYLFIFMLFLLSIVILRFIIFTASIALSLCTFIWSQTTSLRPDFFISIHQIHMIRL